jgi:hypothetical protein
MRNQVLSQLSDRQLTDKTDKDFDPSLNDVIPSSLGQSTILSADPAANNKRRAARQGQPQPTGKASKRVIVPANEYLRAMTETVDVAHPIYPAFVTMYREAAKWGRKFRWLDGATHANSFDRKRLDADWQRACDEATANYDDARKAAAQGVASGLPAFKETSRESIGNANAQCQRRRCDETPAWLVPSELRRERARRRYQAFARSSARAARRLKRFRFAPTVPSYPTGRDQEEATLLCFLIFITWMARFVPN